MSGKYTYVVVSPAGDRVTTTRMTDAARLAVSAAGGRVVVHLDGARYEIVARSVLDSNMASLRHARWRLAEGEG